MLNRSKKGQSLLEVVIVLGVAGIVLGALIIAVIVGLKNAQFAQNQSKSTKYAQEALEKIKGIRDRDGGVSFQTTDSILLSCLGSSPYAFSKLWLCNLSSSSSPCTIRSSGSTECYFKIVASGNSLQEPANLTSLNEDLGNGLSRQIIFEDENTGSPPKYQTEKKVTAKVKWKDSSGEHESNLQTVLTNF